MFVSKINKTKYEVKVKTVSNAPRIPSGLVPGYALLCCPRHAWGIKLPAPGLPGACLGLEHGQCDAQMDRPGASSGHLFSRWVPFVATFFEVLLLNRTEILP